MRSLKNKKAISPVIATVILVAVAVAIAIAVAFWASGLAGTFTKFEKLDFTTAYATNIGSTYDPGSGAVQAWNITCIVSNTGSSDATITDVYVNGKNLGAYAVGTDKFAIVCNASNTGQTVPFSLPTGTTSFSMILSIGNNTATGLFAPGQTVDIKVHTASGTDYPKSVVLP